MVFTITNNATWVLGLKKKLDPEVLTKLFGNKTVELFENYSRENQEVKFKDYSYRIIN